MNTEDTLGHMYYDENKQVVFSSVPPQTPIDKERHRASIVVVDEDGRLGFGKFTTRSQDLLIAGGGVEKGENLMEALHRETREELGCCIKDVQKVGLIYQYAHWSGEHERQHYHCFLAKIDGEKFEPEFTEKEKNDGLSVVWLDMGEALEIFKNQRQNGGTKISQFFLEKIQVMMGS